MILIEKHIIKQNHQFFIECNELCFKSKNLYNQALYNVRQYYFDNKTYLTYKDNYHVTKMQNSYKELPAKVSCQTIKLVDQNFKSFFGLMKTVGYVVKIPRYLDKDGRYIVKFPKQALSIKEFKKTGKIQLSKTEILINTKIISFDDLKEVRIIPRNNYYVIEVVYQKQEKTRKTDNSKYGTIDLGINNLATIGFNNKNVKPFIINGRPLKSINQYYNKKKGELQSKLEKENNKKISKNLIKLTNKRNNKINNYLHKASRVLVNQLVSDKVTKIVIGKNKNWKQDINIGKRNNQNFVQIPHNRFIDMIRYKCELEGIDTILQEESYTSKCSFFDREEICKHEKYLGKRIKRGLFKTSSGKLINADLNGALNIIKKAIPNAFVDGIEGLGVSPMKLSIGS